MKNSANFWSLAESLISKCAECGVDPDAYFREKVLELQERRRILLTPTKRWYNKNRQSYNDFAAKVLRRPLTAEETHGPDSFQRVIERRLNPEPRGNVDEAIKRKLLQESNWRCALCGTCLKLDSVCVDHILPLAEGGSNHALNLQPLCRDCNMGKADYVEDTAQAAARPWHEQRRSQIEGNVSITPTKRFCALLRDNSTCRLCGATAGKRALRVVLRVPQEGGGQAVYDNLMTVCEECEQANVATGD